MQKIYFLFIVFTSFVDVVNAQKNSLSKKDKVVLDSMKNDDDFFKLLKDDTKNVVDISVGIGNGSFSSHNNSANATGINNKLIITPSIVYRFKSGFNFGLTGFLTSDSANGTALYQTGVSAGYDYENEDVITGINYTRFLSDKNKYNNKSLYQNDLYGFIKKAKGIIQPGIAFGFDNGNYKEADMASVIVKRPLNPRGDTIIIGIDSTNNKATYFALSTSIEHDFSFYNIFSKDDELDFVPMFMLNFGKDDLTQTHTNTINHPALKKLLANRKKNAPTNKFQMQSIAASFDFTYTVGKFYLQPNLYLDYYLPSTTAKRFTAIYSLTAGITF